MAGHVLYSMLSGYNPYKDIDINVINFLLRLTDFSASFGRKLHDHI